MWEFIRSQLVFPKKIVRNSELGYLIPQEDLDKTIHSIGIRERRIAEWDVCSSDLCCKAAERLLLEHGIDRDSIGALIFISQTPDYRQPSTAPSLQDRLGLPKTVMAFDINMACSGYVYGLSIAYSLASQDGIGRVLLLVGETMSKTVSDHDKVTTPLFGDAGTATLIEKGEGYGPSCFVLHSDGGARICSACRKGDTEILVAQRDLSEKWMRWGISLAVSSCTCVEWMSSILVLGLFPRA